MRASLFLDASYAIALRSAKDQFHRAAIGHWQSLKPSRPTLVTTSMIVTEVVTILNGRGHHDMAVDAAHRLRSGEGGQYIFVDQALFDEGLKFHERHPDKGYSHADCVSFLVMERLGIREALAFDHHFAQAGFRTWPGP